MGACKNFWFVYDIKFEQSLRISNWDATSDTITANEY